MPPIRRVLLQLDCADAEETREWREAVAEDGGEEARVALAADEAGELVLGSLYVEATYGPEDEDAVGLTIAGVELRPGVEPLAQIDDDWISDALTECREQLDEEQGIEATEAELRDVLTVQASIDVLQALQPD